MFREKLSINVKIKISQNCDIIKMNFAKLLKFLLFIMRNGWISWLCTLGTQTIMLLMRKKVGDRQSVWNFHSITAYYTQNTVILWNMRIARDKTFLNLHVKYGCHGLVMSYLTSDLELVCVHSFYFGWWKLAIHFKNLHWIFLSSKQLIDLFQIWLAYSSLDLT